MRATSLTTLNGTFMLPFLNENQRGFLGLGPYLKYDPLILLDEIENAQKIGIQGICLFECNAMTPESRKALRLGPFR